MKTFIAAAVSIFAIFMLLRSLAYDMGRKAALRDMRKEADSCLTVHDFPRAYYLYEAIYDKNPEMIAGETASNASHAAAATGHDSIATVWRQTAQVQP